jgi:hypothetical protein
MQDWRAMPLFFWGCGLLHTRLSVVLWLMRPFAYALFEPDIQVFIPEKRVCSGVIAPFCGDEG